MTAPDLHPHASLPIRGRFPVRLSETETAEIRGRAATVRRADPELAGDRPARSGVSAGLSPGPSLLIHDLSDVRRSVAGPHLLEYRSLLLAANGDQIALGVRRSPAFEDHVMAVLGLSDVPVTRVEGAGTGWLAAAAGRDPALLDEVARRARAAGRLNLRPYVSTRAVWGLARRIAARARVPVTVAGPTPVLADRTNDKLWFTRQVTALLGRGAVPPSAAASDQEELAERILQLGGHHAHVAVRLRSASSGEGNLVIPTDVLGDPRPSALASMLRKLFGALEWDDVFPLQVAVWEEPVLASPSVQTWVPAPDEGPPVVEGVFEQRTDDRQSAFAGATTSDLPDGRQAEMARDARIIAGLFQELGYFGRCSFDAILVGDRPETALIHWVECNGRWGGASIPMTAVERITGDWTRHPFVVLSLDRPGGRPLPADAAYDRLAELLLMPGSKEGALLLSPSSLEAGRGLDLLAIAGGREAATRLAEEARRRLLGT